MPDPVAQAEFDRYLATQDQPKTHPADADDADSPPEPEEKNSAKGNRAYETDDETDQLHSMSASTATYHIPRTTYDANTGPKGVIADAQSFQRARKSSFRKTFLSFANGSYFNNESRSRTPRRSPTRATSPSNGRGDQADESDLMERWRQSRLKELEAAGNTGKPRLQPRPTQRMWGFFKEVDAREYIDVVEKTPSETMVIVCIYDPESDDSTAVEEILGLLARKHPTTRFVKLHHAIADMETVTAPAIIAYRNGDVTSMLTDCTAVELESTLRRSGMLVDTEC